MDGSLTGWDLACAYHETGHGVMLLSCGWDFAHLELNSQVPGRWAALDVGYQRELVGAEDFVRHMKVSAAGDLAQIHGTSRLSRKSGDELRESLRHSMRSYEQGYLPAGHSDQGHFMWAATELDKIEPLGADAAFDRRVSIWLAAEQEIVTDLMPAIEVVVAKLGNLRPADGRPSKLLYLDFVDIAAPYLPSQD